MSTTATVSAGACSHGIGVLTASPWLEGRAACPPRLLGGAIQSDCSPQRHYPCAPLLTAACTSSTSAYVMLASVNSRKGHCPEHMHICNPTSQGDGQLPCTLTPGCAAAAMANFRGPAMLTCTPPRRLQKDAPGGSNAPVSASRGSCAWCGGLRCHQPPRCLHRCPLPALSPQPGRQASLISQP